MFVLFLLLESGTLLHMHAAQIPPFNSLELGYVLACLMTSSCVCGHRVSRKNADFLFRRRELLPLQYILISPPPPASYFFELESLYDFAFALWFYFWVPGFNH